MDSQTAEWIWTTLCRHDPWVPTRFLTKKISENGTPGWGGGGKRNLNFLLIKKKKKKKP